MSIMDKIKSMAGKHSDKVRKGLDQAADTADRKTGGKYGDKIDTAKDRAKDYIEREGDRPGGERGQGGQRGQH